MITVNIDLTRLDSSRITHYTRKNGTKAEFLELVLLESPGNQYGDYIVKQSMTKEERSAGKELPILGDAKIFRPHGERRPATAKRAREMF